MKLSKLQAVGIDYPRLMAKATDEEWDVVFHSDFKRGWRGMIESMQVGNIYAVDAETSNYRSLHSLATMAKRKILTRKHPRLSVRLVARVA